MPQRDRSTPDSFIPVLCCFVLSGAAGLIYQTAWTDELSLAFGTSELAVAAVLAAYMAGLMAGAWTIERLLSRVRRPLRTYAWLEVGIAATALLVPVGIAAAQRLQVALFSQPEMGGIGASSAFFYLAVSFAVLLPPVALMGATLPLLILHSVRSDEDVARRTGLLYGANTVGAAVGALVTAFVILPALGLEPTVWIAVALNLLVAAIALFGIRGGATALAAPKAAPANARSTELGGRRFVLPVMLLSGAVAFGWEILWTRLLGHLLGGSIYAFGLMLGVFLIGLAAGSALTSRLSPKSSAATAEWFAVTQLGVALCSWLAFLGAEEEGGGEEREAGRRRRGGEAFRRPG
ncbi:MAG: hypothetical protein AAFY88_08110 [Acidobacteriota bacterium]